MLEITFQLANLLIFLLWIPLFIAPYAQFTQRLLQSIWLWIGAGSFYFMMILLFGSGIDWMKLAQPSLTGIASLFAQKEIAAIAWIHLIIFDLFVGRWIVLDAAKRKGFVSIFLLLCLMAGPLGLAAYLIFRRIRYGKVTLSDANAPM